MPTRVTEDDLNGILRPVNPIQRVGQFGITAPHTAPLRISLRGRGEVRSPTDNIEVVANEHAASMHHVTRTRLHVGARRIRVDGQVRATWQVCGPGSNDSPTEDLPTTRDATEEKDVGSRPNVRTVQMKKRGADALASRGRRTYTLPLGSNQRCRREAASVRSSSVRFTQSRPNEGGRAVET